MSHPSTEDVVVIGAGIIGVAVALALARAGHPVRLLDRKGIAAETSRGNAGAFAFTDIAPLAAPGIMRKAPRWLLDPLGPLSVPPGYALRIAPWMLHFRRATRPDRFAAGTRAQAALMTLSRAALDRQIADVAGEALMRREGQLQLYEGLAEFEASLPSWQLRQAHGVAYDLLRGPEAIAEIQPGLSRRFTHAGFTPTWMNTVDPAAWTGYLADQAVAAGARIETCETRALRPTDTAVQIETTQGMRHGARVVVAAGAWSHHLARTLGDRIPLETERGYNTTFPTADFDLKTHLTFPNHGFVVSRIGEGLRVGGAVVTDTSA